MLLAGGGIGGGGLREGRGGEPTGHPAGEVIEITHHLYKVFCECTIHAMSQKTSRSKEPSAYEELSTRRGPAKVRFWGAGRKNWPTAKNMYRSTAMDEKVEEEALRTSLFLDKK
jgi:hypothetical protein